MLICVSRPNNFIWPIHLIRVLKTQDLASQDVIMMDSGPD